MKKYLLFLISILVPSFLFSQSLQLNGNVTIENASSEGARIIIYKNNIKLTQQDISKKGRFDFKLALDADYKITFEKSGYITKNISVNTEVPGEIIESNPNFPPIKLTINLLPKVEQVDLSIFEQPVAILSYNYELDDFTFDKEYSDKIKDRIAQAEKSIKQVLAGQDAESLKKEQMYAQFMDAGKASYELRKWEDAISQWKQALQIKPSDRDASSHIELAKKEAELEKARQSIAQQNERTYKILLATADSLFTAKNYIDAKNSYSEATRLNSKDPYPADRVREINDLLAEQSRLLAEKQKQQAAMDSNYGKLLLQGDRLFNDKEYQKALVAYQEALTLKPQEAYPKERIAKTQAAIEEQKRQLAAEQERQKQEAIRRQALQNDYRRLIAEGDAAFQIENYALAKIRYTQADSLNLGEEYPKKQLVEITNIIHSAKYKNKLAEFNKNKNTAEKALLEKNYASAKFYYQRAMDILPIDKENIEKQIIEIDKQIEAEQLAAVQKEYKEHIGKADKAFKDKAYAVAKFYYQKALGVKINDSYAKQKLQEVEKHISSRQEKAAEL